MMENLIHNRSELLRLAQSVEAQCGQQFADIDRIAMRNTEKVLSAFSEAHVSESCFAPTTGYGYDDKGRTVLEQVYAKIFCAEAALVRPQFVNGTHTIACALYGNLSAGDTLLCATGMPYDTLQPVIFGDACGSLESYGVRTAVNPLMDAEGRFDFEVFLSALRRCVISQAPTVALIQRSKGYAIRPSFSPDEINRIAAEIKKYSPDTVIILDNCYGEFVCEDEILFSAKLGVDAACGSLIKNPGGGLAPTGGYIVGTEKAVNGAATRLCVPGIGGEAGSYASGYRLFYQGLFVAPHVVAQALKTAVFTSAFFQTLGFAVSPEPKEPRNDIIQTVSFGSAAALLAFMKGIQAGSPVDSYVTPEPWAMPGYADPVVMAAGTFVSGASIELSADGPMRSPFTAYMQGGITYESGKLGILRAAAEILGIAL